MQILEILKMGTPNEKAQCVSWSIAVVLNHGSMEPLGFGEAVLGVRRKRPLKSLENFAQPKVSYYQKQQGKYVI